MNWKQKMKKRIIFKESVWLGISEWWPGWSMPQICRHVHQGCYFFLYSYNSNPQSLKAYFNFLSHYLFQGTKGACEKNMEEAFKYSLKVRCSSKIEQVYLRLFCNSNSSLGLWIGKHGWLCKCKYLPPIHIYHISHDHKLGTSIT